MVGNALLSPYIRGDRSMYLIILGHHSIASSCRQQIFFPKGLPLTTSPKTILSVVSSITVLMPSVCQNVEQWQLSHSATGNVNLIQSLWKTIW